MAVAVSSLKELNKSLFVYRSIPTEHLFTGETLQKLFLQQSSVHLFTINWSWIQHRHPSRNTGSCAGRCFSGSAASPVDHQEHLLLPAVSFTIRIRNNMLPGRPEVSLWGQECNLLRYLRIPSSTAGASDSKVSDAR